MGIYNPPRPGGVAMSDGVSDYETAFGGYSPRPAFVAMIVWCFVLPGTPQPGLMFGIQQTHGHFVYRAPLAESSLCLTLPFHIPA